MVRCSRSERVSWQWSSLPAFVGRMPGRIDSRQRAVPAMLANTRGRIPRPILPWKTPTIPDPPPITATELLDAIREGVIQSLPAVSSADLLEAIRHGIRDAIADALGSRQEFRRAEVFEAIRQGTRDAIRGEATP